MKSCFRPLESLWEGVQSESGTSFSTVLTLDQYGFGTNQQFSPHQNPLSGEQPRSNSHCMNNLLSINPEVLCNCVTQLLTYCGTVFFSRMMFPNLPLLNVVLLASIKHLIVIAPLYVVLLVDNVFLFVKRKISQHLQSFYSRWQQFLQSGSCLWLALNCTPICSLNVFSI